jgi:DNA-binding response OmpR family regulator/nitrogen-specific signal transduction histidine kinase
MPRRHNYILVVDDDDSGRYASSRALRRAGYEVIEAATGAEALRLVAADRPDLVVLDVRLPDINGLEVSSRIKSTPDTANTLVLQMSASSIDDQARVAALDSGADGYIVAPAEPSVLVATVRALLRLQSAEQAVAEAARDWQTTFDAIRDGVALLDPDGAVRRSNAALPLLLGLEPEWIPGRLLDELIPPAPQMPGTAEALATLRRSTQERTLDDRTFGITIDPMADDDTGLRGGVVIVTDITERCEIERGLRHSQKLESIGLLAGGVAHDFNNLLMGILGNASLALDDVPQGGAAWKALTDVMRASERAADLTRQLLAYAGKGRFVVEPVDLSALVQELVPLIHSSIPRKARLILNLAPGLPPTQADKGQIEQVVMNLLINAAEALEDGSGTVTVTSAACPARDVEQSQFLTDHELRGDYIRLTVEDTGVGMDEETRSRIFDPFFSTKFLGRGLGLSATLGIVRGHKGAIRVTSTPGNGTTFEVLFPASAPAQVKQRDQDVRSGHGEGTILVVDDEETIRKLMKVVLQRKGYEVLAAENGAEALTIFSRNASRISLIVLDLVMPVMSGEEVLPHLLAMRPGVKVIVSSGQDSTEGLRKLGEPRVAGYLQKPYRADALASKVQEVLSGVSAATMRPAP